MPRIFKSDKFPFKDSQGIYWTDYENWAIEFENGEKLYGAFSCEDLEEALIVKPVRRFTKQV